jgi:3-keto-disaccharide hydrolase
MIARAVPRLIWLCAIAALPAAACSHNPPPTSADLNNRLSGAEQKAGWKLLFDGKTMDQWRGYKMDTVPAGWKIVSGVLMKSTSTEDLMTKEQFANFELEFDWRIGSGGNAGVFYRGSEEYEHVYWTAPEYQLLDDLGAPDGRSRLTSAGAAYGLYPSPIGALKPIGEWNTSRIVVNGAHVEHWLNGKKLLQYELGSPDWEAKVKASKFAAWPDYGRLKTGHIAVQGDHDGVLALRDIKIKVLP